MKIGLVLYGNPETISGGNIYDRQILSALIKLGHTVGIISLRRHSFYHSIFDNYSKVVFNKISALAPDILLEDELVHSSLFLRNHRIRKQLQIPVISIVHNLTSFSEEQPSLPFISRIIERRFMKSLDGYICISKRTQRQINQLSSHISPSVISYPAGNRFGKPISESQILERSKEQSPLRILFLGNVTPNKQLDVLLRAIHSLNSDHYYLDIVGRLDIDPGYVRNCQQLISQFGLERITTFHDSIELPDKLAEILIKSHVLVLPSKSEGFPVVLPEAAHFGIPAIITNKSAADEFVTHTINGFLVAPDDTETIAKYLQTLNADRDYLSRISIEALHRFYSHPTWETTGQSVADFLEQFAIESKK